MPPPEPLIHWPQPLLELAGFIASFLASGAIGFRFAALRPLRASADAGERGLAATLAARAAALGLAGALASAALLARALPGLAARRHLGVGPFIAANPPVIVQILCLLLVVLGLALAAARRGPGWPIAAAGVLGVALRSGFFAQWARLVNPLHVLAGGLWIGTLVVLVAVGLPGILRSPLAPEHRGAAAARLVYAFSPLALSAAAMLAVFGVITAWRNLKFVAALWTTPYGITLVAKLCVVMAVLALGAWNWRRQRPRLGTEAGAIALRRTARVEILVAAVVLVITAFLVSLPAPRPPAG